MTWAPIDQGRTLGQTGSEDGVILRDLEHPLGARVTLERDGRVAPFAITFGVYGWMVHTCFFDSEVNAAAAFDELMRRIEALCELIATKGDEATFEKPDGVMSMDVEIATAFRSLVDDH